MDAQWYLDSLKHCMLVTSEDGCMMDTTTGPHASQVRQLALWMVEIHHGFAKFCTVLVPKLCKTLSYYRGLCRMLMCAAVSKQGMQLLLPCGAEAGCTVVVDGFGSWELQSQLAG